MTARMTMAVMLAMAMVVVGVVSDASIASSSIVQSEWRLINMTTTYDRTSYLPNWWATVELTFRLTQPWASSCWFYNGRREGDCRAVFDGRMYESVKPGEVLGPKF